MNICQIIGGKLGILRPSKVFMEIGELVPSDTERGEKIMRRDKERIRTIMLRIQDGTQAERVEDKIDTYHIDLLVQAGWVEYSERFSCESFYIYTDLRLTWDGCEFAELLNNESAWSRLTSTTLKDAPFSVILHYLKELPNEFLQNKTMDS